MQDVGRRQQPPPAGSVQGLSGKGGSTVVHTPNDDGAVLAVHIRYGCGVGGRGKMPQSVQVELRAGVAMLPREAGWYRPVGASGAAGSSAAARSRCGGHWGGAAGRGARVGGNVKMVCGWAGASVYASNSASAGWGVRGAWPARPGRGREQHSPVPGRSGKLRIPAGGPSKPDSGRSQRRGPS